ncbi:MAG: 50S ribosomal protein L20 [Actinobacteria bacterium]|nr:50S ribosomal protein L20 [Cyanobacteriota bacterium]MCL5772246.1 50S ribosomal protein L20 [Actinomycetota bacterium]
MARIKRGIIKKQKHKKILEQTKGYYGLRGSAYRIAKEQLMKSLSYNYIDRKARKRDFRRLWITRINIAARSNGLSYNEFINGLKKANIEINRKMLSDIAVNDAESFKKLVDAAKVQLSA